MPTPIEAAIKNLALTPVGPPPDNPRGLPYVTHEGIIDLGTFSLKVYQFSDGRRIVDGEQIDQIFGSLAAM